MSGKMEAACQQIAAAVQRSQKAIIIHCDDEAGIAQMKERLIALQCNMDLITFKHTPSDDKVYGKPAGELIPEINPTPKYERPEYKYKTPIPFNAEAAERIRAEREERKRINYLKRNPNHGT